MGRIRKGVLGGFSGTVGTVVGSNWKGIEYMRSLPTIKKKRISSQKQLQQQARFAVANRFIRSMSDLYMLTYDDPAANETGVNSALSDVLKRAVVGTYPSFSILYNLVYVSRGSLHNASTANATAEAGAVIRFNWVNTEGSIGKESPNDRVILVAYSSEFNRAVYRKGALRSALTDTLSVPGFVGESLHTWITFLSEDEQDYADSLYTGQIDIQV
ncbi:hypothetical protein D3H65_01355 [Paraflavitalea soli]|uniref:Uncharacterized protein n=1 Tax=Paraflavitalea soli TaxID=2315862 RepID=A0A3B7MHP9_9BACT|nr:DUF6266 family protein [Paraflavitalea soli]AXY72699.1 hypothetical protein D3H65_01355 [Paraflavitalea soli]